MNDWIKNKGCLARLFRENIIKSFHKSNRFTTSNKILHVIQHPFGSIKNDN